MGSTCIVWKGTRVACYLSMQLHLRVHASNAGDTAPIGCPFYFSSIEFLRFCIYNQNLAASLKGHSKRDTTPRISSSLRTRLDSTDSLSYTRNVEIVEALCQEARQLGAWPAVDPLDGINTDVRLARAINVHTTT